MKARVLVSYAVSIAILWLLIEVLWGATGGAIAGLTIARDPAYQERIEAFLKQRGITATTPAEIKAAVANLSREDRTALGRITRDALRGSQIGGLGMTLFVSALAFGAASFIAGYSRASGGTRGRFLQRRPFLIIRFAAFRSLRKCRCLRRS